MQRSPQTEDSEESMDKEVVIAYSSKHLNDREMLVAGQRQKKNAMQSLKL